MLFCTTRQAFHPAGALTGPYEPLNGSGLVIQNPPAQPDQAYAWLVLPDLSVESFVNYLPGPEPARARFGGTVAPTLDLVPHGASTALMARTPAINAPRLR